MAISTLSNVAAGVRFDDERLYISLVDGREVSAPLSWFPRLAQTSAVERAAWRLIGQGEGIHWPAIDEDLSVAHLLGLPCD